MAISSQCSIFSNSQAHTDTKLAIHCVAASMLSSREHAHYPLLSFTILLCHPSLFCFSLTISPPPPLTTGHYHTLPKITPYLPIFPGVDSYFHWRTRRRRVSYDYRRVSNDYWTAPASSFELFHCRHNSDRYGFTVHFFHLQHHEENEWSLSMHALALTMRKISSTHAQMIKDDPAPSVQ